MRIVLLAGRGSRYAARVAEALERAGVPLSGAVVVSRTGADSLRMFRSAARSAGWARAVQLALGRLVSEHAEAPLRFPRGVPVTAVRGIRSPAAVEGLRSLAPDLVVLAQPGLVGDGILAVAPVINGHPGCLPAYRGLDCGKWAVLGRDFGRVGASVHWVDAGIDTGPVLAVRPLASPLSADPRALDEDLDALAASLLAESVAALHREERVPAIPQARVDGVYCRKMGRRDEGEVARILRAASDRAPLPAPCAS